jgi:hypothetical protein
MPKNAQAADSQAPQIPVGFANEIFDGHFHDTSQG